MCFDSLKQLNIENIEILMYTALVMHNLMSVTYKYRYLRIYWFATEEVFSSFAVTIVCVEHYDFIAVTLGKFRHG